MKNSIPSYVFVERNTEYEGQFTAYKDDYRIADFRDDLLKNSEKFVHESVLENYIHWLYEQRHDLMRARTAIIELKDRLDVANKEISHLYERVDELSKGDKPKKVKAK